MKFSHAACLIGLISTWPLVQAAPPVPDTTKPTAIEPIQAKEHSGPGRIGVRLAFDKVTGLPQIAALTRGGPAADFGFRVGDVIIKIDRNYTSTLTQEEVSMALHGDAGSGVELTVQRDDNPHYIIRAVERRVLPARADDMVNPPMSEVMKNEPLL